MQEETGVILFELWDSEDKLVGHTGELDQFPQSFITKAEENFRENGFRNIYRKTDQGSVRLIVRDDDQTFQGTKWVNRGCQIYLSLIPQLKQLEKSQRQHFDSIIKRFAHNLIKFQIRFKGNFSRLISDNARSRPFSEFQEEVKRMIESNTSIAAQDVCQISHRAVDLDAQIETLGIISGYADVSSAENKIKVSLQKTIYRLVNPFVDELRGRGIIINNSIPSVVTGEDKVLVDPTLLNAAVWQLLDNISKYARDNSQIDITADLRALPQKLEFSMISVRIDEDEKELIFLERKKGRHAKGKAENGIGLFIVKKALSLMGAKIYALSEGEDKDYKDFKYSKNRFVIEFEKR
ncbi:MAG: ATP-binding protein [Patescibacteria group bacterium]|nr:ATP-binding protein [Patescibacteria group bacterium]